MWIHLLKLLARRTNASLELEQQVKVMYTCKAARVLIVPHAYISVCIAYNIICYRVTQNIQ